MSQPLPMYRHGFRRPDVKHLFMLVPPCPLKWHYFHQQLPGRANEPPKTVHSSLLVGTRRGAKRTDAVTHEYTSCSVRSLNISRLNQFIWGHFRLPPAIARRGPVSSLSVSFSSLIKARWAHAQQGTIKFKAKPNLLCLVLVVTREGNRGTGIVYTFIPSNNFQVRQGRAGEA